MRIQEKISSREKYGSEKSSFLSIPLLETIMRRNSKSKRNSFVISTKGRWFLFRNFKTPSPLRVLKKSKMWRGIRKSPGKVPRSPIIQISSNEETLPMGIFFRKEIFLPLFAKFLLTPCSRSEKAISPSSSRRMIVRIVQDIRMLPISAKPHLKLLEKYQAGDSKEPAMHWELFQKIM